LSRLPKRGRASKKWETPFGKSKTFRTAGGKAAINRRLVSKSLF